MSKSHKVQVHIKNNTKSTFTFKNSHFEHGHLAGDAQWQKTINPNGELNQLCYESSNSIAGCSGWVEYTSSEPHSISLYFSFSNPPAGRNKIDVGTSKEVWNNMEAHLLPKQRVFAIQTAAGQYMTVDISSTGGETNNALWVINDVNTSTEIHQTLLKDATQIFKNVNEQGSRIYYDAESKLDLLYSHFKGVGAFNSKLIFTHTNVATLVGGQGIYLIGNQVAPGLDGAVIEADYYTQHEPEWGHPGGIQVCGSYMAVGIQKTDDSKDRSEIQIYDIRPTQINQPMKLVTTIKREGVAINGTGMTRMKDGHYIVACTNGKDLSVYRSDSNSSSISNKTGFKDLNPSTLKLNHGGAGIGLVTQEDGKLFLFEMHASTDGPSTLNLYEITIDENAETWNCTQVDGCDEKTMKIPGMSDSVKAFEEEMALVGGAVGGGAAGLTSDTLNSSFRWGKGLFIASPTSVEFYATDRNILPNAFSGKNFSVVTWQGNS